MVTECGRCSHLPQKLSGAVVLVFHEITNTAECQNITCSSFCMKGCILVEVLEYYVPVLVEILEYYLYWWKYRPLSVPFLIFISGISQPSRLDESVLVGVLEYFLYWWKCLSTICTICCDISCCPLSDNRTSATLLVSFCLRQHYLVTVLLSI